MQKLVAALIAVALVLFALSALGVLDPLEPEELETLDPEVIFKRVEAVLAERATG